MEPRDQQQTYQVMFVYALQPKNTWDIPVVNKVKIINAADAY